LYPFHENPNEYLGAIPEKPSLDFLIQDAVLEANPDLDQTNNG
jgi:hypothetical protein